MSNNQDPIIIEPPKPRNKQLNDILRTRKGGTHYDPKGDYVRAKEKKKVREQIQDTEQE